MLLTGRTFRAANATCHEAQGSLVDLTRFLASKLNFTTCFVLPPDGLFGNFDRVTGSVSGVVGMAARREVAFVITGLSTSASRAAVIDFSIPFMHSPSAALIRREAKAQSLMRVLAPFEGPAWAAVAAAVVTVGLVVTGLSRASPLSGVNLRLRTAIADEASCCNNTWSVFGATLEQGLELCSAALSARCTLVAFWVFCLVVINSYTANLITYMTAPDLSLPVQGLEDLTKQTNIKPITVKDTFLANAFATTSDPVGRQIWSMHPEVLPKTPAEALEMVRTSKGGRWAYMSDLGRILSAEATDCHAFAALPEVFMAAGTFAMARPQNAYYADRMDFFIQNFVEKGAFQRASTHWFRKSIGPPCASLVGLNQGHYEPMELTQLFGPLVFLGIGLAAGVLVFAIEMLAFRQTRCT